MSLLECMYLGKLCLVNDVIGSRDVIQSGVNGFVCKTADEFVDSLRTTLREPDRISALTERAKKDILEKYNTRIMAEKYREIYEEAFNETDKKTRKRKKD